MALENAFGPLLTETDFDSKIGSLTEAAPTTDIASSGVNGRLKRIAQNISSLIAKFTTGQTARASALGVTLSPEDITALQSPATQPVSGSVSVTNLPATQPVSAAALPLPGGASTEATLALIKAKTDNLDVALSTRTKPADTQPVSAAALPLPAGASTGAKQDTQQTSLSSIDLANGRRYLGGKIPYAALISTAGTTQITPTTGKAIRVVWVAFIPNSDNGSANLVTIKFNGAAGNLYVNYAIAHWEVFTGAVDQKVDIILSNAQPVAVNIHYEEI